MKHTEKPYLNLDLDGVFADLSGYFKHKYGYDTKEYSEKFGIKQFWEKIRENDGLFFDLKPLPYANDLFDYANQLFGQHYNIRILTAIPRRDTYPHAEAQKEAWVRKYISKTVEFKIGPHGKDKHKWVSRTNDILLDDTKRNIDDWNKAGGIGLLHITDYPVNTFKMLYTTYREQIVGD